MLRAIALATTLANAAIRIEENVPRVKKGKATFDGWRFLGPWPSGKTEYEGDPLAAHGGVYAQLDGAAPPPRFAEHGGDLGGWRDAAAAADGAARLGHDHVDVQGLMRSPPLGTAQDVIHVQYWVAGKMRVTRNGTYTVSCRSLHAFELRDANGVIIGPLLGDVYGRGHATPLKLGAGAYDVVSRVRGKLPLQFSCAATWVHTKHVGLAAKVVGAAPDLVRGRFVNDAAVLCLELRNLSPTAWKFAHATLTDAGGGFALGGAADPVSLAPGSTTSVLLRLAANGPADDVEADGCAEYEIYVAAVVVKGALRCRARSQSALMTFADGDGSLGAAGVLFPRRGDGAGNSVVLSLAGVGVSAQAQADAYKRKVDEADADYTFGFEDLWVLCPDRAGPHNWEDLGLRTAERAVRVLAADRGADATNIVVHGHSRGGHGAWGFAVRFPDLVRGVFSACGWSSREEYGDANNLWTHETALAHADRALLGTLQGAVGDNDNALFLANLRGAKALVRVASRDRTVSPWFGRKVARLLDEHGADVELDSVDADHWWWDTARPNDGGAVHDDAARAFTLAAAAARRTTLADVLAKGPVTVVAGSPQTYGGRFGLRVLDRPDPGARAFATFKANGTLETRNARRLALAGEALAALPLTIDGDRVDAPETCCDSLDLCRENASWAPCAAPPRRPPELRGPMRHFFAEPWVVVLPRDYSDAELALATYVASNHYVWARTSTRVVSLADAAPLRNSHRFLYLGLRAQDRFPDTGAWPVRDVGGALRVGDCAVDAADGPGAAFLAPSPAGRLDLVVTASRAETLAWLATTTFASNQPHTRAPFSNMLPDFVVVDEDARWTGVGGVRAAGYFDDAWGVASGFFSC